jgi:hypothetical protein
VVKSSAIRFPGRPGSIALSFGRARARSLLRTPAVSVRTAAILVVLLALPPSSWSRRSMDPSGEGRARDPPATLVVVAKEAVAATVAILSRSFASHAAVGDGRRAGIHRLARSQDLRLFTGSRMAALVARRAAPVSWAGAGVHGMGWPCLDSVTTVFRSSMACDHLGPGQR